jgi:CRP/FNR family transcriptional regulator, cyclic AMP receptor protein
MRVGSLGRERGFLSLLSDPLLERMTADSVQKKYDDGQLVHGRGEKKPGFGMIRKGRVRIGTFSGNGSFVEYGSLRAGDVYGELTVITGIERFHDSYAIGQTVIDHISVDRFQKMITEIPELQLMVLRLMARRLQHAYQRIDDILRLPLIDRVGRHLLETQRRSKDSNSIAIKQSDLAEAMAASRVSISKALSKLSELGFVNTGYGRINLVDQASLTQWLEDRNDLPTPLG